MEQEQPSSAAVSSGNAARSKFQRYGLRSSSKSKEHKPDATDRSISSESTKRGRSTPSVSRSVGVLDFSGKEKSASAKPPRRLSIPTKSSASPSPKLVGNITPISETRTRRSGNGQGPQSGSQTPISDISRTSSRMKFNLLSSASYWLNQIKLSESASKHSVSLGFFKLALEAGCEPFQKMQDELKAYVRRHQLAELGEPVKQLLDSYNIAKNVEQPQVSESISQVPEEGTRSSDDEVHCTSSTMATTEKLSPKSSNTDSTQLTPVKTESTKKEICQKNNVGSKLRENPRTNSRRAFDSGNRRSVKKLEKPSKQETNKEKGAIKKQGKKSNVKEVPTSPKRAEDIVQGDKENMDIQTAGPDETSLTEVF